MFQGQTVFVVGAGGSYEVGLPVSVGLKNRIRDRINFPKLGEGGRQNVDIRRVLAAHAKASGADYAREMENYWEAAQAICASMPQAISIDNYLHTHANDQNIVMLGKMGIAACILEAERGSEIFAETDSVPTINFHKAPNSWHNIFCQMLTENVQRADLESIFDNITFITFNYDRCIEHYILTWLVTYMRLSLKEGEELCRKLKIFHPYGQVGRLPWQQEQDTLAFGAATDMRNIPNAAQQIKTFTERVEDEQMLAQMRHAISQCERLVFLGFAFGQMNMDLLATTEHGPRKRVYATTFGVSEPNRAAIRERILNILRTNQGQMSAHENLHSITAQQLLTDYWYELSK